MTEAHHLPEKVQFEVESCSDGALKSSCNLGGSGFCFIKASHDENSLSYVSSSLRIVNMQDVLLVHRSVESGNKSPILSLMLLVIVPFNPSDISISNPLFEMV